MTYMSMIGVLSKHGEDPFIYICENTGKRYNTIWEASEDSGCSIQGIKNTCAGHQHTTNTFVWRRILKEEYYYLKDYHNFPENELLKE